MYNPLKYYTAAYTRPHATPISHLSPFTARSRQYIIHCATRNPRAPRRHNNNTKSRTGRMTPRVTLLDGSLAERARGGVFEARRNPWVTPMRLLARPKPSKAGRGVTAAAPRAQTRARLCLAVYLRNVVLREPSPPLKIYPRGVFCRATRELREVISPDRKPRKPVIARGA